MLPSLTDNVLAKAGARFATAYRVPVVPQRQHSRYAERRTAEYVRNIVAVTEAHGGRYLVRGGATEVVEGSRTPHRVVVIEFENLEGARGFVNDPEYVRLADIRGRSSITTTIIVEGV